VIHPLLAATEGVKNPGLWYPTILGILVVVSAVVLFCGSVYLLLATNLGAKLGFLVAAGALSGFMVLLSMLWLTTASPLNTLKGRVPSWKPVELLQSDISASKIPVVAAIKSSTPQVLPTEATNVKAAVDAVVVTPKPTNGEAAPPATIYDKFDDTTQYLVPQTFEVGGGPRRQVRLDGTFPWVHLSYHNPKYAVATICPVLVQTVPFGDPIPAAKCDPDKPVTHLVLERDLGSLRVPPFVVFLASSILFGLSLLGLHWRERDLEDAKAAAEAEAADAEAAKKTPAKREPEPANA
jgi:hypothetical protein